MGPRFLVHDAIMGAITLSSFRSLARCLQLPVISVLQQQSGLSALSSIHILGLLELWVLY